MPKEKEKPAAEYQSRGVRATIWSRTKKTNEGREYVEYSVVILKSYKDKDDAWQETNNYFPVDLPSLSLVCSKAFEYISLRIRD